MQKTMARKGGGNLAANKSFGLKKQSSQKSWARLLKLLAKPWKVGVNEFIFGTCNLTKNHLEWLTLLKKLLLGIFQVFCLQVSEDLLYRTPSCMFVVNKLCTVIQIYVNIKINN